VEGAIPVRVSLTKDTTVSKIGIVMNKGFQGEAKKDVEFYF
jgi:hypothetical protein